MCCVFPEASANLTVEVCAWEWEFALDFAADRIVALNLTPAAPLKHKKQKGLTEELRRKCHAKSNRSSDVCCEHKLNRCKGRRSPRQRNPVNYINTAALPDEHAARMVLFRTLFPCHTSTDQEMLVM